MKKHLFLSVAALLCALTAMADPITPSQAKALAASYMKTSVSPQLVRRKVASTNPEENQPLYIFSRGVGQGFVMISGDDALPVVLGITDQGDFDESNLPPALQDMIDYYTQAAKQLQNDTEAAATLKANRVMRRASGTKDIATLMTSHWHQSWPYNNKCPHLTSNGNTAATGCVATATSQIIYYWRRDCNDRVQYNTPTYGYGDAPATEEYMIPKGTPLKWDLMQDSYSGSDPQEGIDAVATLVACEGMSGWLTYGSSTAGQISDQIGVMSGQFGLNGGTCVWKGSYSQTTWEKMIISDLELGRPILYSGVHPSNGGHAVVVDGYQLKTNLFHFNFGWGYGNGYDGYYTVDDATGMNGFCDSQGMVYNICAKKPKLSGKLSFAQGKFLSRVDNTITAKVTNNGTVAYKGLYLYCLTGTNKPTSSSNAQDEDTQTVIATGETATLTFSFKPSSTSTYTIYLCDANKNILDKIEGVTTDPSKPDLTLTAMRSDDGGVGDNLTLAGEDVIVWNIFNTKKANITATFKNSTEGTLCMPSVKGLYSKYDAATDSFGGSTSKTKKNTIFQSGGTGDIVFDLSDLTDGAIYKFTLEGTASTNTYYPINYATADTVIYFKLVGADMSKTVSEDGAEATITGHYNPTIFATLTADSTVSSYDMTQVSGVRAPLTASNQNALFYTVASQQVDGPNIIADGVCQQLDLTPGYNFQPREDFQALKATYHCNMAKGKFGVAYLPFDAEVPTGLFARKVNQVKVSYLQEVDSCDYQMFAGTPYVVLNGEDIDITAQNVKVSTETPSLGTDTLRGTWVNQVATETQYVLDDADPQYFNTYTGQVIPALTGYLEYTKKVRATSYPYNAKDKKAVQLAQEIASALATYDEYAQVTSRAAKQTLMQAIEAARDTLHTQPVTATQSEVIKALEAAVEAYTTGANITADNGYLDKTNLITNPSFEATNATQGWTRSSATDVSSVKIYNSKANYMSGADGNVVMNLKDGSSIQQTLTDIPNGTYQMEAVVAADYDGHIALFAGNQEVEVAATDFGPMYMTNGVVENVEVTDGTLTLGAKTVDGWARVDNFRLYLVTPADGIEEIIPNSQFTIHNYQGIFDLQGRRLSEAPQHGIYIHNGRKIIR